MVDGIALAFHKRRIGLVCRRTITGSVAANPFDYFVKGAPNVSEKYSANCTGPILVGPFNDFLSEGGQNWDSLKEIALEGGFR